MQATPIRADEQGRGVRKVEPRAGQFTDEHFVRATHRTLAGPQYATTEVWAGRSTVTVGVRAPSEPLRLLVG